jgi:hypothetical protein
VQPVRRLVLAHKAVGSAWGAVPGLLRIRFPRPPAEPDVRVSPCPALHGICRWGGLNSVARGVGIVLPR